jgi:hypothetical protein
MPLILGTNSIKDTGFDVANSCRFESAYLNKSVTASSSTSWTLSFWIKIHSHSSSAEGYLWSCGSSSAGQGFYISTTSYLGYYGGSGYGSDSSVTNGVLRDPSAWYHVVFKVSSGTGTTYINGTQQTGTVSSVAPLNAHTGDEMTVNTYTADKAGYDDCKCSLAEYCFIDGTAYSASDFGEFDEDSPRIWKPKDVSGLTFGTNGFYLDFEDSSALGDDAKGSFDFTVNSIATTDQSTDTPTNNWCTWNALTPYSSDITLSEGNLNVTMGGTSRGIFATIGVSSGKWYYESKWVSGTYFQTGVVATDKMNDNDDVYGGKTGGFMYAQSGKIRSGGSDLATATSLSTGNIIGVALDMDNGFVYFALNGTWQNSGDPESGATGTGGHDISAYSEYTFGCAPTSAVLSGNFGSPSYANSSDAADANGYGAFEYAPPSGYYALNTKNLADYG